MAKIGEYTIKETRINLSNLVERASLNGEIFLITKFGKPKAMLSPIVNTKLNEEDRIAILKNAFGLWKDRKDIKSPISWVSAQRKNKYGKIFG